MGIEHQLPWDVRCCYVAVGRFWCERAPFLPCDVLYTNHCLGGGILTKKLCYVRPWSSPYLYLTAASFEMIIKVEFYLCDLSYFGDQLGGLVYLL